MLKVLVLAKDVAAQTLMQKLRGLKEHRIVAIIPPQEFNVNVQSKYKPDLIITSSAAISDLLHQQAREKISRTQVKAITHQGIRLVPVDNIFYFQAEHKYVTAYHTSGQLLIEDTLHSLEREFADVFVRIHRKTLVAINKIENLFKTTSGEYYVKLHSRDDALMVSRRQLPQVRKILKDL